MLEYDSGIYEVADRVWIARYEWQDVNITVVEGTEWSLLIDTHSSTQAAKQVIEDVQRSSTRSWLPADTPVFDRAEIDLGDRVVELLHLGPPHTPGVLIVSVPDANLVEVGDLLEETGPPVFVEDSFPQDWPLIIDRILERLESSSIVVPGHGIPQDRSRAVGQRE